MNCWLTTLQLIMHLDFLLICGLDIRNFDMLTKMANFSSWVITFFFLVITLFPDLAVFCSSVLIMLTLFLSYRMEMPVVEVHKHGVWLLAKSVDLYIHRILVEEDAKAQDDNKLWNASSEAGEKLYKRGDFLESQVTDLDVYLLKKVKI
ncbi:hypothetical protein BHE74_00057106 [Ensete ventricosum]|nr:hypothetical protein BHE74_00057106 [Ensete ventricosum]RZS27861.1 hypothetical protein BHM03_00061396 [Ensete ventricosum]